MMRKLMQSFFDISEYVGRNIILAVSDTGYILLIFFQSVFYSKDVFRRWREIAKQMYVAGVKSFVVSSIVSFFTGMVLTLQTGLELMTFQQEALVGDLVITVMTREMGPFTAALVLTASVGSAMAAEIGTMKVSEEIDALEMMAIHPVSFLVMPRVVALSIMLPVVTIYSIVMGTYGGAVVANFQLSVPYDLYYAHVLDSLRFKATYVGMLKSYIFGIMISSISCARGLQAKNGAIGVGQAVRSSVVISFLMILIVSYFITSFFYGKNP